MLLADSFGVCRMLLAMKMMCWHRLLLLLLDAIERHML